MKKGTKVLAFSILGLFLASFLIGAVDALTVFDDLLGKIGISTTPTNTLSTLTDSTGFGKFLMFILVALIVYGIAEFLPFLGSKPLLNGAISIVIGLLSTVYLSKEEVLTSILAYSALGVTLTLIIPFCIIAIISMQAHAKGHYFLGKFLWVAFFIIATTRFLFVEQADIGAFGEWTYIVLAIAAIIMFFWGDWIFMQIMKAKAAARGIDLKEQMYEHYTAQAEVIARQIESMSDMPKTNPTYMRAVARYNAIVEKINANTTGRLAYYEKWKG